MAQGPSDVLEYGDSKTRASLAQTLAVKCGGDVDECPAFTMVVNHLKSKGSSCDSIGDPDAGDGQVMMHVRRRSLVPEHPPPVRRTLTVLVEEVKTYFSSLAFPEPIFWHTV